MPRMSLNDGLWLAANAVTRAADIWGPDEVADAVFEFLNPTVDTPVNNLAAQIQNVTVGQFAAESERATTQILVDAEEHLDKLLQENNFKPKTPKFKYPRPYTKLTTLLDMARDLRQKYDPAFAATANAVSAFALPGTLPGTPAAVAGGDGNGSD